MPARGSRHAFLYAHPAIVCRSEATADIVEKRRAVCVAGTVDVLVALPSNGLGLDNAFWRAGVGNNLGIYCQDRHEIARLQMRLTPPSIR